MAQWKDVRRHGIEVGCPWRRDVRLLGEKLECGLLSFLRRIHRNIRFDRIIYCSRGVRGVCALLMSGPFVWTEFLVIDGDDWWSRWRCWTEKSVAQHFSTMLSCDICSITFFFCFHFVSSQPICSFLYENAESLCSFNFLAYISKENMLLSNLYPTFKFIGGILQLIRMLLRSLIKQ